jgi:hypothetical protein
MTTVTGTTDRHVAIDALDRAIVNLCARTNASTYELLVLIREFDERCQQMRNALPDSVDAANRTHAQRPLRVWRYSARSRPTRWCR